MRKKSDTHTHTCGRRGREGSGIMAKGGGKGAWKERDGRKIRKGPVYTKRCQAASTGGRV